MLLALAAPFVLMACYSLGAQWLMLHAPHSPATVAFVLGPVVLGVATGLWTSGRRALALLLLAAAGGGLGWLAWHGLPDITPLYVAEYVTVYGAMAWLFCSAAMRQAQPTSSVSTATPPTTASQMRRYRRWEKARNNDTFQPGLSLAVWRRRSPRRARSGCVWGFSGRPRWPRGCGPCARRWNGRTPQVRARARLP